MSNDKLYTAADLEQARADERARWLLELKKLYDVEESSFDRIRTVGECANAIRALGPIKKNL